ncbi:MAG: hypothetical protein AABX89_07885 [Candidatus Thermoplasmatota archaeon]
MKSISVLLAVLLSTTMLAVLTPAQAQESPVDQACGEADPSRCADGFFVEFFANAAGTSALLPALSFTPPAGLTIYARPQIANEAGVFAPTAMQLTVVLEVDCGGVDAADGPVIDCNQGEFPAGDAVARKTLDYTGTTPLAFKFSAEELQNLFAPGVSVTAVHLLGVFSGEPAFRTSSYHPLTQAMFANDEDATADSLDRSGLWQPVLLESVQPTYNALRNGGFEGPVTGFDLNDPLGFGAFRGFQGNDFTLFTTASDGGKFNKLDTASGGEVVAAPGLGLDGSQAAKGGKEGHYAGGSGRTTKVALESDGSPLRNLLAFSIFVKTGPTAPMTTIQPFFRIDTNRDGISDNCLVGDPRPLAASPEFTRVEFSQNHPYFLGNSGCPDGPGTPLSDHQSNPLYATASLRDVYFQTKAPIQYICGSDAVGGCASKSLFGATDFVLYDNAAATVRSAPPLPDPVCLAIDDNLKELLEAQLGPGYDCAHANSAVKHIAAADWYIEAIHAGVHYYIGPGAGGFSTFAPASTENRIFLGNSNDAGAPQAGSGAMLDLCPKPGAGSGVPIGNPALTPLCGLGVIGDDGGSGTMLRLTLDAGDAGVCTVDLKRAGPTGTAFAQYAQYSDLDNDGALDQAELTGAGDGNPLSSCVIGVPNPISDSDGDGLDDADEDVDGDGQLDSGETDPANADTDGDGLNDCQETGYVANSPALGESDARSCGLNQAYATNPRNPDSDVDGLSDGDEVGAAQPSNPTKVDSDADGVSDSNERSYGSNPMSKDHDSDGLEDGVENADKDGVRDATETSAILADSDVDQLNDCRETVYTSSPTVPVTADGKISGPGTCGASVQRYATNPLDADSDGDTFNDGAETTNTPPTNPTDPASKPDPDSDADGVSDVNEDAYGSDPATADTDGDGLDDGDENTNRDGDQDVGETDALDADSDADGLTDCQETVYTSSPTVPVTADGKVSGSGTCGASVQRYATNPLDVDSDNDLVNDGVEVKGDYAKRVVASPCNSNAQAAYVALRGLFGAAMSNGVDVAAADTAVAACDNRIPTNPTASDTDSDLLNDSFELGQGGTAASGKYLTDPTNPHTDTDGIMDGKEVAAEPDFTDPTKLDTDGDTLSDGDEDADKSGSFNAGDPSDASKADTDGDTIRDEVDGPAANNFACRRDQDCDDDGLRDDVEDANKNGVVNDGEPSPILADTDSDGLTDCQETVLGIAAANRVSSVANNDVGATGTCAPPPGFTPFLLAGGKFKTSPRHSDSDGDTIRDDLELLGTYLNNANDQVLNPTRPDSDLDGLTDCQETVKGALGLVAETPTFEVAAAGCPANEFTGTPAFTPIDGKKYATDPLDGDSDNDGILDGPEVDGTPLPVTNPTKVDSDGDGIADGVEDANKNGATDAGESSAASADTDSDGLADNVEDADQDGVRDPTETQATVTDSDADGLTDCQETGYVANTGTTGEDTASVRNCGAGVKKYKTDPLVADSDGDSFSDGAEVNNDPPTNPTDADSNPDDELETILKTADEVCDLVDVGDDVTHDDCADVQATAEGAAATAAAAAAAGPLAILNTLRLPDPVVAATDVDCNFLDPLSWGLPVAPYGGTIVRMQGSNPSEAPEAYAARLASNGFIDWSDAQGDYLLWDGTDCHDLGDPADDGEVAGEPDAQDASDSVYSQHLGNYILNTVTGAGVPSEPPTQEELEAMADELAGMLAEQLGDAYAFNLADQLDVADVDEDGVINEPNGQVDLIEQRLLIVDPHGTLPTFPLGQDGSGSQASPLTGELPDDRDGVSLLLRNPVGGALVATVSAYAPAANEPVLIVEAFQGTTVVHLCVILQPTPSLVGPFTGRYDGDCAGAGPTVACPQGTTGTVPNCTPNPVSCGPLGGTAPECVLAQIPEELPQPCDPVEDGVGVDGDCEPLPTGLPAVLIGMLSEALCSQVPTAPPCEEEFLENLPGDVQDAVADATEDLPGSAEDALPSCGGAQVTPTVYVCYAGGGLAGQGIRVKAGPLTLTL